ncbi:AMP-binding protein [Glaciibacter psychrotolerans]|uniref:Acyl-CoA synthetase (AMP-forming)/AMP-acid ligase II n=1 Tax=Glaciibacter psychrotolerans TaxID=670054 RepID=A0A7Z0EF70_9MICO|nr:AMP-binding protein [Leifsonia psychrotolerans]NYJ20471.1 acyl-CoA synthetase (AMP-forming)/AMP-acid ligase II [Leifsonia psychrotolerans]
MSDISSALTIPALLNDQAALGHHSAIVEGERTISYAELRSLVHEVSRAFLAHGVIHGDRVALWAPNRTEFILAMLGAQAIGASVVPLNTRYTGREAAEILDRSRASALVLADGFLGRSFSGMLTTALDADDAETPDLSNLRVIVNMDEVEAPGCLTWSEFLSAGATVQDETLQAALDAVHPDDVVDILYTSGTTGRPKGVMSAHRQTLGVAHAWVKGAQLSSDDRYAVVNPFFHGFGYKAGMITSLVAGATIYPVDVFEPEALLALIAQARISVLPGVPTIFTSLIDHPRRGDYDLSSLRFAIAGATAAPDSLFHDMVNVLGFRTVAQAYGLTECVVATLSRPGESLAHAAQTTGPAVENTELRIVDEHGADLPVDTDGEILIRGSNVMLGYFEDQAATDAVIDSDGWFHTGDVGRLDEHGCLKITDRIKDMFIVGGFNVYPAEIENVLRRHPAVNESAVVEVTDARLGHVGRAYVALLHDADPRPNSADLEAFCRERLANFKVPRDFIFVDDFPRNATGKIQKAELREAAAG